MIEKKSFSLPTNLTKIKRKVIKWQLLRRVRKKILLNNLNLWFSQLNVKDSLLHRNCLIILKFRCLMTRYVLNDQLSELFILIKNSAAYKQWVERNLSKTLTCRVQLMSRAVDLRCCRHYFKVKEVNIHYKTGVGVHFVLIMSQVN